jgi:hypothetical protein
VRGWALLGVLVGLAMLVRTQNLAFALPACAEGAVLVVGAARRGARALALALLGPLAALACALVTFFPQLLAWKIIYGAWVGVPQGAGYIRWDAPSWSETLFSSRNGLFPYAPLWLVGLLGLVLVARRDRWLGLGLLATFVVTTYLNGAFWHWWGMGSFGGRRFDGLVYPVALGVAALARVALDGSARRPRLAGGLALGAVGGAGVVLTTAMSVDFGRHLAGSQPDSVSSLEVYQRATTLAAHDLFFRWGNPIEWPAALAFSLRTGAPMKLYEEVVGPQLLDGYQVAFQPPSPRPVGELAFASGKDARYLVRGFGAARAGVRPIAATARFLVPLNITTAAALRLEGSGRAAGTLHLRWNGEELASAALTPGAPFTLACTVPAERVERGVNLVDLAVDGATGDEVAELSRLGLSVP